MASLAASRSASHVLATTASCQLVTALRKRAKATSGSIASPCGMGEGSPRRERGLPSAVERGSQVPSRPDLGLALVFLQVEGPEEGVEPFVADRAVLVLLDGIRTNACQRGGLPN